MPTLIKPPPLAPNSTIGVVAPASAVDPSRLEAGVSYLESLGYRIEVGPSAHAELGHLAGNDDLRLNDLHRMFDDPKIDAIFCARGGYGTPRILDRLDFDLIRRNPKIFVGYSDITALQLAILHGAGLVTFSGPMVGVEFAAGPDSRTESEFWQLISEPAPEMPLQSLETEHRILCAGTATGPIIPGCLSMICDLIGTPWMPELLGHVLVVEDVGEKLYRIDKYLAHLANSGELRKIAGFVAGQFIDCEELDTKPALTLDDIFLHYLAPLSIPVLTGLDYGHGPVKHTLPVGVRVQISDSPAGLTLCEPAVAAPFA